MLKRFTKVLAVWGAVDASICAGLLIYAAIKAVQTDLDKHKWAHEQKTRLAADPFLEDCPDVIYRKEA